MTTSTMYSELSKSGLGRHREGTNPRNEMQEVLKQYLREGELAQQWRAVETAETLEAMMAAAWVLARALVLLLMSQVLEARAAQPVNWPTCKACGRRLRSQRLGGPAVERCGRDREVAPTHRALSGRVQDRAGGAIGPGTGP